MVINTSSLIDAPSARADRYRPVLSLSSEPVGRLVDLSVRTTSPNTAMFMGEVRPVVAGTKAVVCERSQMSWRHGTDHNFTTVFGGDFAGLADDIQTRVGPPPPRRRSV